MPRRSDSLARPLLIFAALALVALTVVAVTGALVVRNAATDQALAEARQLSSNVAGQTWQVRLTKNGNQIFSGTRVTRGASGSFELRRVTSDPAGDDVFRARATHAGEVCAGRATF